jgi:hypothetical protein
VISTASPFVIGIGGTALAALLGLIAAFIMWRRTAHKSEISMSVRRGSARIDVKASGNNREVYRIVNEILASLDEDEEIVPEHVSDADELSVVRAFNDLERAANEALGSDDEAAEAEPRTRGLFALRRSLREAGFWSIDELGKFDNITRLRNAIVHGDSKAKWSSADVRNALADAGMLRDLLRSRTSRVDEYHQPDDFTSGPPPGS